MLSKFGQSFALQCFHSATTGGSNSVFSLQSSSPVRPMVFTQSSLSANNHCTLARCLSTSTRNWNAPETGLKPPALETCQHQHQKLECSQALFPIFTSLCKCLGSLLEDLNTLGGLDWIQPKCMPWIYQLLFSGFPNTLRKCKICLCIICNLNKSSLYPIGMS